MPVLKCPNGKFRIGSGKCIYDSKKKADRAYQGYLGSKYSKILKGGIMENRLNVFAAITKMDEDLRMVYGVATCSKVDSQNEIVDWDATKEAVADYSNWRNIREMHKNSAVGTAPILELREPTQELYIGAKIVDEAAWQKCKEGVYKGFSIGGDKLDQKVELSKTTGRTVNRITKYNLNEISLVDRPANPACKFQTVKRDTSVHTVTISEDPLKSEAARVMEKSLIIAKRVMSKEALEALPDTAFGLIKVTADGDTLIKHRSYPMPDKTHAINMIRKSIGDPISDIEKARIHDSALLVLGKKHVEGECPYCVDSKLKGGVEVDKVKVEKQVTVSDDGKSITVSPDVAAGKQKAAEEEVKTTDAVAPVDGKAVVKDEEAPAKAAPAEAAPAKESSDAKLDRIIALLEGALGGGEGEEPAEDMGMEEEVPAADVEEVAEGEAPVEGVVEDPNKPKIKVEDEDEEAPVVGAKVAEEKPKEEAVVPPVKKVVGGGFLISKRLKAIIEPLAKENKALKARLEKIEKAPLPRKEAKAGDAPVKVEKYQDVKLEKKDSTFSENLTKDITKAQELRMTKGVNLSKEEDAFCQRVASQMLEEKLSK